MKVIAKKILYEQDLYHFPDENVSYGLFPLEIGRPSPIRNGPQLVYRKGEIKEFKFEIKKYCCKEMKNVPETMIMFKYSSGMDINGKTKIAPGCFIFCPCWEIEQSYQINFCPSCGEKIEIEEEK